MNKRIENFFGWFYQFSLDDSFGCRTDPADFKKIMVSLKKCYIYTVTITGWNEFASPVLKLKILSDRYVVS